MHENKYDRNRVTGILGVFLLGMGLVTSSGAGAVVPAALGFAKEPMAPIGEPDVPLDRWTAEDPDWRYRPKTLEQAVWFSIERINGKRIVQDDMLPPTVYWQWRVDPLAIQDRRFVDSIHNCRLRYTGSGDRWFPIRLDGREHHLSPDFEGNLWAYLDESGKNVIWDFELKCDTANGTETLRRRAIIDVSDNFSQREISYQDRIFMVPQNGVLPYRKGEPIRFVWDLDWSRPEYKRYENDPVEPMVIDRGLPCKLIIDYFPYAIVSPRLYAYDDPAKRAAAMKEDPTMKPSDFLEPGKDEVIDITQPKGEVTIRVKKSASVTLSCKSASGDTYGVPGGWLDNSGFENIWVYDEQDPSEPPFAADVPEMVAEFTDAVDTDRYWAETPPVAKNCAAHYAAGRTADGTYWIADNLGLLHEKFCAMSVPGYEGFMWLGSFVPDAATAGYRWQGDEAADCVSPDTADAHYCAPAVIDALRAKYTYQGGEVGLYAPDTGKVFLYDVNRNPDAAELAEFRSFLESHIDGGHTVTLWMR